MDKATNTQTSTESTQAASAASTAPAAKAAKKSRRPQSGRRPQGGGKRTQGQRRTPEYTFPATAVVKDVAFGSKTLSYMVDRHWGEIDFSLNYVVVHAPSVMKKRLVTTLKREIEAYIEKMGKEVEQLIEQAAAVLADASVEVGKHNKEEHSHVKITSRPSRLVLNAFKGLDEYHLMMGSAWIEGAITPKEYEAAEAEAKARVASVHRLVTRAKDKLIQWMRSQDPSRADEIAAEVSEMMKSMMGVDVQLTDTKPAAAPSIPEDQQASNKPAAKQQKRSPKAGPQAPRQTETVHEPVPVTMAATNEETAKVAA